MITVEECCTTMRNEPIEISFEWEINNFNYVSDSGIQLSSPRFTDVEKKYGFSLRLVNGRLFIIIDSGACPVKLTFHVNILHLRKLLAPINCTLFRIPGDIYTNLFLGNRISANTSTLKISCTVTIILEAGAVYNVNTSVHKNQRDIELFYDIATLYENDNRQDVVFVVDNKELEAHKFILCAQSAKFKKIIEESTSDDVTKPIHLEDISDENFQNILKFIYTGDIEFDYLDIGQILEEAVRFELPSLQRKCVQILRENLNPKNAVKTYAHACLSGTTALKQDAWEFMVNNPDSLKDNEDLQILVEEHPTVATDLLKILVKKLSV